MTLSACLTCRHARQSRTVARGHALCVLSFMPVDVMHVCHDYLSLLVNEELQKSHLNQHRRFHDVECSDRFSSCSASTTATNSPSGEFSTVFTPATDSHQWEKLGSF